VHSYRKQFILKGKTEIKYKFEEKLNKAKTKREYDLKFDQFLNFKEIKSKKNDIDVNTNAQLILDNYSEKYQLNQLYLKCSPIDFVHYSKNKLKKNIFQNTFVQKKSL